MAAKLVYADERGRLYDHPQLTMAGKSGAVCVPVPDEDLIPLPEGTRFFTMPGSRPVGIVPGARRCQGLAEAPGNGGGPGPALAAAAFLPPGYTRTLLPATHYPAPALPLPLWGYTALGWQGGRFVAAAVRVDPIDHSEPRHYDDRVLLPTIEERMRRSPDNRLLRQLIICATEYHCLPAKNIFLGRWEAPIPTSPRCNADCVGCLSFQPAGKVRSSHDRIAFVPTPEEIAEACVAHLEAAPEPIVSFGQGCEGEPLQNAPVLEQAIRLIRERTAEGTINLNTNGSFPERVARLCAAGLDSIRVSLNSPDPARYAAYYRPDLYGVEQVVASIKTAKGHGIYTTINLLVFPGVTDAEDEAEGILRLVRDTGLDMIQLRNLCIDPDLYLRSIPLPAGRPLGIRSFIRLLRREFPRLELGYVNRPKHLFGARLCETLPL
ncbi:MAG TPA: radical SAM protein [Candidatus Methylomirabilis sp.]|jgi:pyruvate-formate lyase-activating enzyme